MRDTFIEKGLIDEGLRDILVSAAVVECSAIRDARRRKPALTGSHSHVVGHASTIHNHTASASDNVHSHAVTVDLDTHSHTVSVLSDAHSHTVTVDSSSASLGDPTDSGSGAGAPRHGEETRGINASVNWIIKT